MTVVEENLGLPGPPDGTVSLPGAGRALATVRLAGVGGERLIGYGPDSTIVGERDVYPAANGYWSLDLVPNDLITPAGTVYEIEYAPQLAKELVYITVPVSGGPYTVLQRLTDPPAAVGSSALASLSAQLGFTHDWDLDGWGSFTPVLISADGAQHFDLSVVGGRGVVTGPEPALGSMRVAYLRAGTVWADSEITSVVYTPGGAAWAGNNAQQGHLHRVREVEPGVWEGIAIWTAVFGGDYGTLNTRAVRFDGTTLFQSGGDAGTTADRPFIDRRIALTSKERTTAFGLFFNNHGCVPPHFYGLVATDIVTIDSTDATFDQTDIAVNGVDPANGVLGVIEPTTLSTSAFAVDKGHVTPSGVSSQKRWTPYVLSTRIRGGTDAAGVVELKRWRLGEPTPDWSDPRVVRQNIAADADVPTIPTEPGHCALWGAHFYGGSNGSWGGVTFKQV